MVEFTSFAELGLFLEEIHGRIPDAIKDTMEYAASCVLAIAYDKFGHYQGAVGEFPSWVELSDNTLKRRARRGINPNDEPLLESEKLRDSYTIATSGDHIVIGSDMPYAGIQETGGRSGSHYIPARPVLGPAIIQAEEANIDLAEIFREVVLQGRRFRNLKRSRAAMRTGITPGYGNTSMEVDSG